MWEIVLNCAAFLENLNFTLFEGLSIVEPFNFECWIGNGNDLALKVGPLALFDLNGFHGRSENGRLSCLFLL